MKRMMTAGMLLAGLWATGCGGGTETGGDAKPADGDKPATTPVTSSNPAPTGSAKISGTVSYQGRVPNLNPLDVSADTDCAAMHSGSVANDTMVVGDGNALANVLVKVTNPPAGSYPVPSTAKTFNQKGCIYLPHVLGIQKGQTLKILNSDGILHNVHSLPKKNSVFNRPMPKSVTEIETSFDTAEEPFRVKCDVHPWMAAYIAVFDHPYYAVTGPDGSFSIEGLPAGTYQLEAWHEQKRLGTLTAGVTLTDGQAATHDFVFEGPK